MPSQTTNQIAVGDRVRVAKYFGSGTAEREYAAQNIVYRVGKVTAAGLTRERRAQLFVTFKQDGRSPKSAWVPIAALVKE